MKVCEILFGVFVALLTIPVIAAGMIWSFMDMARYFRMKRM